jgi:myo-inositol-1-phosphate synthase
MPKIRIAIAGVGNCASSLIQGIEYYRRRLYRRGEQSLGLMHYDLGGYKPDDIEVVAAFDIDARKVGKPVGKAVFAKPNCTKQFVHSVKCDVPVRMGRVLDGVSPHMKDFPDDRRFVKAQAPPVDVVKVLKRSRADMLLNYLPVGSEKAARFYAKCALKAHVGFVNCIPVFIASDRIWVKRFADAGLPIIGDDVKAQLGATILHRTLTRLFVTRGMKLDRTYQLNTGGNTDFLNMLNNGRLKSKKVSKTEAVQSELETPLAWENIHVGPSDYVPWQLDNKICFLRMEGRGFGGIPMHIECRLSVEDSPNSAGIVIDAIRCMKLALDRGLKGVLESPAAFFMKHPIRQMTDHEAQVAVERFIRGEIER